MNDSSLDCEETIYQLRRIGSAATLGGISDVFKLRQDVTAIGRAKDKVAFYIDSSKNKYLISRIHARIFRSRTQDGKDIFRICDTSVNGTYVNNMKISNEALLRPGDTIAFGHLQGSMLEVGNCYSQPYSEFLFKFESATNNVESSQHNTPEDDHKTLVGADFPDLSAFLETPTPPSTIQSSSEEMGESESIKFTTKRELVKTFDESDADDSEMDYKILQEYASAATRAAERQSESDEDLFAVKYSNILPGGAIEMFGKKEKCKSPEKKRAKRKMNLKTKEKSQSSEKTSSNYSEDSCSAINCSKPNDKLVSWVQCDDCDKWYHVKCAGLSLKLVKPKTTKFHCGCK